MIVMSFKELVDKKNDKVKFDIIPKTNEEYISVTYGCIRFIDSYRFLSSKLDNLVEIPAGNSHKTLKGLEEEIIDNDEILKIVNKIKILIKEDKHEKDLKKIIRMKFKN